jgi:hypothetical protein
LFSHTAHTASLQELNSIFFFPATLFRPQTTQRGRCGGQRHRRAGGSAAGTSGFGCVLQHRVFHVTPHTYSLSFVEISIDC